MKKFTLLISPFLVLPFLLSCSKSEPTQKVEIPEELVNQGVTLTNSYSKVNEKYETQIKVDTGKSGGKVLPNTLKKVTSGNATLDINKQEYTYTLNEDKTTADFSIPAQNVTGNITIDFELITVVPPIEDPTLSMTYRYTEKENSVKFKIATLEEQDITVYWEEGQAVTQTVTEEGLFFEHTYQSKGDYKIDIGGAVGSINLSEEGVGYFASGNQHIISVSIFKEFESLDASMFGGVKVGESPNYTLYSSDIEKVFIGGDALCVPTSAFKYCKNIKNIEISEGVEYIFPYAFYSSGIASIELPSSVEVIEDFAFGKDDDAEGLDVHTLEEINIINTDEHPSALINIWSNAFAGSDITSFIVPKTLTMIEDGAFKDCLKLSSFTFEEGSVAYILGDSRFTPGEVFKNDTSLEEIVLPKSFAKDDSLVGNESFAYWTEDQTIVVPFKEGETPKGWGSLWNYNCDAKIVYQSDASEFTEI